MQRAVSAEREVSPPSGNVLPSSEPAGQAAGQPVGQFVINLCASTTPMALGQTSHPALKRYKFFVSRRREEGRERFRMHLGYFQSQEAAESLLEVVREFYPAAWAGVAPGQKLRNEAAAAAAAAAGLAPPSVNAIAIVAVSEPAAAESAAALEFAPEVAPVPAAPAAIEYAPEAPSAPMELSLVDQPPRPSPTSRALDAVRAAIASLDDTGARGAPTVRPIPELKASSSGSYPRLDDSQVLRVLEAPPSMRIESKAPPAAPVPAPMPAPAASSTQQPPQSQAAAYAVQLMWSVQPIDMAIVPQLAIFAAYTLYAAEGNRDGRRWYGLRLGFFTDPVSARQVAQYVRSEFNSVSVVPVTARECDRAVNALPRPGVAAPAATGLAATGLAAMGKAAGDATSAPALTTKSDEDFRLLDSLPRRAPESAPQAKPAGKSALGKRAKLRPSAAGAKTPEPAKAAKTRRAPLTLEETLEILGAGELQVAENRVELLSDSGVRHLSQQAMKTPRAQGSRFSRLMDKLSERKSGS